jgi:hypothetical protein
VSATAKSSWTERTGRDRLYAHRLLLPAVWVHREPLLTRWVRVTWHRPAVRLQWRLPWDGRGAVAPRSRISRLTRGLLR